MAPKKPAGKAPSAAVKAMQERMKAVKEAEEKNKEAEKAEAQRIAAVKKKEEEEAKKKQEKKAEKEKEKKAAKKGGALTDKQKKAAELQRKKVLELMAANGCTVAGLANDEDKQKEIEEEKKRLEAQKERELAVVLEKQKAVEAEEARKQRLRDQQQENLRAPICCIMGHVDTGKTKLLDKIRRTNVQAGEAGGITQQIGASFFPIETVLEKTRGLNENMDLEYRIPGLLIIDTPGHESFTNLRSRGSGLCDIAILVIDIMHGLEPQTRESIQLLKQKKCPFIVALNKVDRLYDWKEVKDSPFRKSLASQEKYVQQEFETRCIHVQEELQREGLNSCVYWKNKDFKANVSLVPTSAHSGEGIPDLLLLMTQLTQKHLGERITLKPKLEAVILEVKVIEGLGHTIDVILVNGILREGDTILLGGMQGPIMTHVRALLTPQPLKEMRVKGEYVHHKELKAACGIKICANDLEHAVAGSNLLVVPDDIDEDDLEAMKDQVNVDKILKSIETTTYGVTVQASTLGSLEALLCFLKDCKPPIPVGQVNIGPIHKKHILRTMTQLEGPKKEMAVILAFDVQASHEAEEMADKEGITIFKADIIYHLFDMFTAYMKDVQAKIKSEAAAAAVFPCELTVVPNCVFNAKDPIVLGVEIQAGVLKIGTPLCCIRDGVPFQIGRVMSIEKEHKEITELKKKDQAAVKINPKEPTTTVGRHFMPDETIYSLVTRESLDALKQGFRDEMDAEKWKLCVKLKKMLSIL